MRAHARGYHVIYTKKELLELSPVTEKVLGIFAAKHTFNDLPEEELQEKGLPNFNEGAPTVAEMTRVALTLLESKNKQFLIVIEEEGSDNFANKIYH